MTIFHNKVLLYKNCSHIRWCPPNKIILKNKIFFLPTYPNFEMAVIGNTHIYFWGVSFPMIDFHWLHMPGYTVVCKNLRACSFGTILSISYFVIGITEHTEYQFSDFVTLWYSENRIGWRDKDWRDETEEVWVHNFRKILLHSFWNQNRSQKNTIIPSIFG